MFDVEKKFRLSYHRALL